MQEMLSRTRRLGRENRLLHHSAVLENAFLRSLINASPKQTAGRSSDRKARVQFIGEVPVGSVFDFNPRYDYKGRLITSARLSRGRVRSDKSVNDYHQIIRQINLEDYETDADQFICGRRDYSILRYRSGRRSEMIGKELRKRQKESHKGGATIRQSREFGDVSAYVVIDELRVKRFEQVIARSKKRVETGRRENKKLTPKVTNQPLLKRVHPVSTRVFTPVSISAMIRRSDLVAQQKVAERAVSASM
jgi:hypothetical protein